MLTSLRSPGSKTCKGLTKGDRYVAQYHNHGRMFFLVDKEGIIRGKWIGEDLPVFSTEMLLKAAREIVGKSAKDAGAKKPSAM